MRDSLSVSDPSDWDTPVSGHLIGQWAETIEEAIRAQQVYFQRSISPPNGVKKPRLVGFFDGSEQAFSGAVYIVWMCFKDQS